MVVMAFDEQGQADSRGAHIEICERSYRILNEHVGVPPVTSFLMPTSLQLAPAR